MTTLEKILQEFKNLGASDAEAVVLAGPIAETIQRALTEGYSHSHLKEQVAQAWYKRPAANVKRLLVWESSAPGDPWAYVKTEDLDQTLDEDLALSTQVDFRDASEEFHTLYSFKHLAKNYLVYDNGSDYQLIAYEFDLENEDLSKALATNP